MKLTLGFSTCPNDTFIFDAMVHNKIDTEDVVFDVIMADVEELNQRAINGDIDITKLSYYAYACVSDKYKLLTSGSALGLGNGPLLISKKDINPDKIKDLKVAIPGKNTTANLLFSIFYPDIKEKPEYLFSDIEDAIISDKVDAGVIIHETRFTYQKKGLNKIADLGKLWENKTNSPIPLGGIVVNRKIDNQTQQKINRILQKSVKYAFNNPESGYKFMKQHSQEMNNDVMQKHIKLYVNDFTLNLGDEGKRAIKILYEEAIKNKVISSISQDIFVY